MSIHRSYHLRIPSEDLSTNISRPQSADASLPTQRKRKKTLSERFVAHTVDSSGVDPLPGLTSDADKRFRQTMSTKAIFQMLAQWLIEEGYEDFAIVENIRDSLSRKLIELSLAVLCTKEKAKSVERETNLLHVDHRPLSNPLGEWCWVYKMVRRCCRRCGC